MDRHLWSILPLKGGGVRGGWKGLTDGETDMFYLETYTIIISISTISK